MNPEVMVYAQVAAITVALTGSLSTITVMLVRALHGKPKRGTLPALPPDQVAQIAVLQQSVDAIAIELERMAEGQRFRDRLLAERSEV